ncbi:Fet3 protein [Boletus edulis]|uniref:Fet3 ferroxidase protein n=1 Tax=Boletus edulis BED1 TaxID=1328754 RepID=A0AAD4BM11_BOLED|nr:Fet3 protein [Boletus edulis]KAF8434787.1 Fet3 ferroxidase protein [Boletus edulis BED1]
MLASLFSLLSLAALSRAGVQEEWWNITYVQNVNPDGLFPRRVIGVNNTWPPPPLDVNTTDSLVLHVTNSLDVPTTVHHHGMFFNSTSWMDGAAFVSQCGIPPGDTWEYVVPINNSGQHGTYWAHSHYSGQYTDGLRTPLILHPANGEAYTYDEEFTVNLGDWYHTEQSVLLESYINVDNPMGDEPTPDSGLVYYSQNGAYLPPIPGSSPTSAVGFNENSTLNFVPGKTYRLRIVNMSAFGAFAFWIDGHNMTIIEVDGTDTQQSPADMLYIAVAQRYSVLVQARNDTSSNWAVHANLDTSMFPAVNPNLQPNVTSSITYTPTDNITDLGPVDCYEMTNDTALAPLVAIPQYNATANVEFLVVFQTMDDGTSRAMLDGYVYNSPLVPAIVSALTLGENATNPEAYGPLAVMINHLDVVNIVVNNSDTGAHPFHLHGHTFQIVNRAIDYTSSDPTLNPPLIEGQPNPVRRDTVIIPAGSAVTLRVVADNPGAWIFHCHIEWHLEDGLAVHFIEAPLQAQERAATQIAPPPYLFSQCAAQGSPDSGNAAGHASVSDLSGLPLGPFPIVFGFQTRGILAITGCILTAVIGMITVVWYAIGVRGSEEEIEQEVLKRIEASRNRGLFQ